MRRPARPLDKGMGMGVARRTVFRREDEGDMGRVADRVARGNLSLVVGRGLADTGSEELELRNAIASGALITSGRHLQHGDADQARKPLELHTNCFDGETKIATIEHGPIRLSDLAGQTITLKAADGEWREAVVHHHGIQAVNEVTFRPAHGSGLRHTVRVTPDHRWFLRDGSVTNSLSVGDYLASAPMKCSEDDEAVLHGLIFGDGHSHKIRVDAVGRRAMQGRDYCSIRLCSDKDKELLPLFSGFSVKYPPHAKGDPVVYVGKKQFWKDLPFTTDPAYIAGFINGWWRADGSKSIAENIIEISTANEQAAVWLKDHAVYGGYSVTMHRVMERRSGDGSFPNGKALHVIRLRKGVVYCVESIVPVGETDVYCPEEPVTSGFVLANGILTGNCSTAILSFAEFFLLLNGSGVGASYDDELRIVDWAYAPNLVVAISSRHRDIPQSRNDLFRFGRDFGLIGWNATLEDFDERPVRDWIAAHIADDDALCAEHGIDAPTSFWEMNADGSWTKPQVVRLHGLHVERDGIVYHRVADSREGWGKALELYEAMTHARRHHNRTLVLSFSDVRPNLAPIGGMQGRPASGPFSVMRAFINVATKVVPAARARDPDSLIWWPWEQAMHVDHHFSVEVQVGGARRAARMATKSWRDPGVFRFIRIKSEGGLWTSNNSVMADTDFWSRVADAKRDADAGRETIDPLTRHAYAVFNEVTACSFINGEPGIINGDRLEDYMTGSARQRPVYANGEDFSSRKYKATFAKDALAEIAKLAATCHFPVIVNPCVTADTWITTKEGARQVRDLIGKPFMAFVDGGLYEATGFWKTGSKPVVTVKTKRGYEVRCTHDHRILVERSDRKPVYRRVNGKSVFMGYNETREWVEAAKLVPGDRVVINNVGSAIIDQDEGFDRGWLVGQVAGDGGYNDACGYHAYARFWGEYAEEMAHRAYEIAAGLPVDYHRPVALAGPKHNLANDTWEVESRAIGDFVRGLITSGDKVPTEKLEASGWGFVAGFLRGIFDADGSVQGDIQKGRSVRLSQANLETLKAVQRMLTRYGILSTIYENRRPAGSRILPDGKGGDCTYECRALHELVISRESIAKFSLAVGFYQPDKSSALASVIESNTRGEYGDHFVSIVTEIVDNGDVEDVYDCTVDDVHCFDANGIIVHNCAEIPLHVMGGYCVIGDNAFLLACPVDFAANGMTPVLYSMSSDQLREWDDAVERSVRLNTRFLMRVNLMDALYGTEVKRTNRIGVSLTGIHEWAWARFGHTFHDLLNETVSAPFWRSLERMSLAAKDEARRYAEELGVEVPVTVTTVKPAGSTSKLYGLSEGVHLPARRQYLRWVQFRGQKGPDGAWLPGSDPLLAEYEAKGYPVRQLKTFDGMSIVGFPTVPLLSRIMPADLIVTASEATPDEQYRWLKLLERYWIGERQGGQISYTLKLYTDHYDLNTFRDIVLTHQPDVRCCSILPQKPDHEMLFEYLPEQETTLEEFAAIVAGIADDEMRQDIDMNTLACASGACPI